MLKLQCSKPELPFPAESNTPAKRFRDVLFRVRHNFPIYGVIRTEVLRSTSLYKNFYGADKLLLAELALRGRFKQIEEPLFIKRVHLQMSSYLSKEEKWQQTNADIPMERQFLRWPRAYLPAALAAPLALPERLRCLSVLLEKKLERTIRFRKEKIHH